MKLPSKLATTVGPCWLQSSQTFAMFFVGTTPLGVEHSTIWMAAVLLPDAVSKQN